MADPVITMPSFPALGLPEGTKEQGKRVDFKPDDFDLLIETKGYLLAWTRACPCPCTPVSEQTEQPDPNCELCKGEGWLYFGSSASRDWSEIGDLDGIQKHLIESNNAMVIRGIVTAIQNTMNPWDKVGNWMGGSMQVTVRHQNKLAYYDRLIGLDTEISYSEIREAGGSDTLETRYPVCGVNLLRSESQVYVPDIDFALDQQGGILWKPGREPNEGTRLAIHYLCHPTWLVIEHPHVARTSPTKYKTKTPRTPRGDPRRLPIQAIMRLEFLPDP